MVDLKAIHDAIQNPKYTLDVTELASQKSNKIILINKNGIITKYPITKHAFLNLNAMQDIISITKSLETPFDTASFLENDNENILIICKVTKRCSETSETEKLLLAIYINSSHNYAADSHTRKTFDYLANTYDLRSLCL